VEFEHRWVAFGEVCAEEERVEFTDGWAGERVVVDAYADLGGFGHDAFAVGDARGVVAVHR